jgi:hypothetical protein
MLPKLWSPVLQGACDDAAIWGASMLLAVVPVLVSVS